MSHCVHYGICGGCAVDDRRAIDKLALVARALAKAGFIGAPISPLVETPLGTRRRVELACAREPGGVMLGLHRARSAEVVDMTMCVLLVPGILALLPALRVLLRGLDGLRRTGDVAINWLDDGADVLFRLDGRASEADRRKMIAFAQENSVLRVSVAVGEAAAELVAMLAPPVITLACVAVRPAPGAFLQASEAGEAAIVQAVLAGLPKLGGRARLVELFAGIGTLTFALAKQARVEAYEGSADAVAAQETALRQAGLAGRIVLAQRDLARRPLQAAEMAGRAAVVLDPPYAGAARQMKFIADSLVPRVVYVSCNPAALAMDAFVLRQAGYKVVSAVPIDQFPYSQSVEGVVVFGLK